MSSLKIQTLEDVWDGRNNNFNLLRMIGALLIMFAHAMFVIIGDDISFERYPLAYTFGMTTLNLFFVLSGLLVTASWLHRQNLIGFAVARVLRIIPGLMVVAFVCAFVIGPAVSTVPLDAYFSDLRSWLYWPGTVLLSADLRLPGVFEGLPNDSEVNAPIWTLKYEAVLYVGVAIAGVMGWFARRLFAGLAVLCLLIYFVITFFTDLRSIAAIDHFMHFGYAFLIGSAVHQFRHLVPIDLRVALFSLALSCLLVYQFGLQAGEFLLIPSAALLGLWIAFVPKGRIRAYNMVGDYSYGIYIWHYPLEQIVRHNFHTVTVLELYLICLPFVLVVAALSWHFVERPCLRLKTPVAEWLKRPLTRGLA